MEGIGDRLKARAGELGLSGAEVARRSGLTTTRYGHYLQDIREPDLATLVRIYRVLGLRPDVLLGYDQAAPGSDALLAKRAAVAAYLDVAGRGQPGPRPACQAGHRGDHRVEEPRPGAGGRPPVSRLPR